MWTDNVDVPPIYRNNKEMQKHVSRVYNSIKLTDRQPVENFEYCPSLRGIKIIFQCGLDIFWA